MEKLRPRAVIFDLGSTLIEYETMAWDELGEQCLKEGHDFLKKGGHDVGDLDAFAAAYCQIRDKYRAEARESWREWTVPEAAGKLFVSLGLDHDEALLERFFDAYYGPVDRLLYAYDDTADTLEKISSAVDRIGLISNTIFPERVHKKELKKFGLIDYFDFLIFSSTFGVRKPHPDIFMKAANQAGFAPGECVYIGDRYLEDITGPNSIGMPAILKVKQGREYPDDMPDDVRKIDHLRELTDHLDI